MNEINFTNSQLYRDCIEACLSCAMACQHCATECLKEDNTRLLSSCITFDRECALICTTTANLMSIGGDHSMMLCALCADICEACGKECSRFDHLKHCLECEEACLRCAEECRAMVEHEVI